SSLTVMVAAKKPAARPTNTTTETPARSGGPSDGQEGRDRQDAQDKNAPKTEARTFPAGSYIVRMDQPYSRIADSLLDYQSWSANDPQRTPSDDTGWTFPELFNVQAIRVTDVKLLDAPVEKISGSVAVKGALDSGCAELSVNSSFYLVNQNADTAL